MRDELARYHRRCWGPKPFDLSAVSRLDLHRRGIDALRPRDLAGLTGLRGLDLRGNDLATLPDALFADTPKLRSLRLSDNAFETLSAGMFAGLGQLREVAMDGNPGTPFALAVELSRTDAEPWAPAPATVSAPDRIGRAVRTDRAAVGLARGCRGGRTAGDGGDRGRCKPPAIRSRRRRLATRR